MTLTFVENLGDLQISVQYQLISLTGRA